VPAGAVLVLILAVHGRPADRPFFMATTPFFSSTATFADWRWENGGDKDMTALHVDDFYGVPWRAFQDGTPPPAAWAARWGTLAGDALAQGKEIYLSLSPLSGRRTLADEVDAAGNRVPDWAPVDSTGCYVFTGPEAAGYQQAYIRYCRYVLDLVRPRFFSPVLEISLTHGYCPSQQPAFDAWYAGVYHALKKDDPRRVIFPSLQMEALYGTTTPALACTGGETYDQCFEKRLREELKLPMDRVGFSMYPFGWHFAGETIADHDPFAVVQRFTSRRIWVSETGFQAVPILQQSNGCATLVPSTVANETNQQEYMRWLLGEARNRNFEAVNWWLNRDYLDGPSVSVCPCSGDPGTCQLVATWSVFGLEALFKTFGNMALRRYDGTPRPAWTDWKAAQAEPLAPPAPADAGGGRVYPNPFMPAEGHGGVALADLPADVDVDIYAPNGRRVRRLRTDAFGTALWDGRNASGSPVAGGVYSAVVGDGTGRKRLKIAVQR
jgi:hypothetical protein